MTKTRIALIASIPVLLILAITNPKPEQHHAAIKAEVTGSAGALAREIANSNTIWSTMIDSAIESRFQYINLGILSAGILGEDGGRRLSTVGIAGFVISIDGLRR